MDGPAKGRRHCDACRAQRVSFFTCSACGQDRDTHTATLDSERQPVRCWDCRQQQEHIAATNLAVDVVKQIDRTLSEMVVLGAIETAAAGRDRRKRLARHLAASPDVLTSGRPAPRVVCRLAAVLVTAGSLKVVRPKCRKCGQPNLVLTSKGETNGLCPKCIATTFGTAFPFAPVGRSTDRPSIDVASIDPADEQPAGLRIAQGAADGRGVICRDEYGNPICGSCPLAATAHPPGPAPPAAK